MSMTGHNSDAALRELGERINRMLDQKEEIDQDIAEIYKEANSNGHNTKALRVAVKQSREDADERQKRIYHEQEVELYAKVLGVLAETALGKSTLADAISGG